MSETNLSRIRCIVVAELGADPAHVLPETDLESLGADSLDGVNLVTVIESEFGIKVPDSDLPGIKTVGDLVACVVRNTP